ncbi:Transcriptional regulator, PadR family [Chitinispirillum alkaliphilum]|nr:Transcriptional regulator, PadR family [Chitinispirillum alkaliphilum]
MQRSLFLGFIKLHILHHADEGKVYGFELLRELSSHGYTLSPGTLYPILHRMLREGYLSRATEKTNGKLRKCYYITPDGQLALKEGREKARELLGEIDNTAD